MDYVRLLVKRGIIGEKAVGIVQKRDPPGHGVIGEKAVGIVQKRDPPGHGVGLRAVQR